jgi:uncharacterized SAM-binding protein YcdF (DUF218 family)
VEPPAGREAQGGGPGAGRALSAPPSIDDDARRLWDYHHVGHALAPAECIIVLGSHDTRVAEHAADVFLAGWAPLIVLSGNLGALTRHLWSRPEGEVLADVAAARGVPRDHMLIESGATNTTENVVLSRALLAARGLRPSRAIAVQKPYMERRTEATFRQHWPELEVIVTSPPLAYEQYPAGAVSRDDVIHMMVGDLQRLMVYGEKGWSARQDVPPDVRAAYARLVDAGYTRRLLR